VMVLAAAADAVGVFDTEVHDGPAGVRAHCRSNCFPVLLAICDMSYRVSSKIYSV
jgi:hypothetical protein